MGIRKRSDGHRKVLQCPLDGVVDSNRPTSGGGNDFPVRHDFRNGGLIDRQDTTKTATPKGNHAHNQAQSLLASTPHIYTCTREDTKICRVLHATEKVNDADGGDESRQTAPHQRACKSALYQCRRARAILEWPECPRRGQACGRQNCAEGRAAKSAQGQC